MFLQNYHLLPLSTANSVSWMKLGLVVGGILALFVFASVFIPWLLAFRREMRYINMEIQRNHGRERERWIRRKKRLWLSLFPFVRY